MLWDLLYDGGLPVKLNALAFDAASLINEGNAHSDALDRDAVLCLVDGEGPACQACWTSDASTSR